MRLQYINIHKCITLSGLKSSRAVLPNLIHLAVIENEVDIWIFMLQWLITKETKEKKEVRSKREIKVLFKNHLQFRAAKFDLSLKGQDRPPTVSPGVVCEVLMT